MSTVARFPFILPDRVPVYVQSLGLIFPSYFHYYEYLRFNSQFTVTPENLNKFVGLSYAQLITFSDDNKQHWKYAIPSSEDFFALKKCVSLFLEQNPNFINDLIVSPIAVHIESHDLLLPSSRPWQIIAQELSAIWNKSIDNYKDWAIESEFF